VLIMGRLACGRKQKRGKACGFHHVQGGEKDGAEFVYCRLRDTPAWDHDDERGFSRSLLSGKEMLGPGKNKG